MVERNTGRLSRTLSVLGDVVDLVVPKVPDHILTVDVRDAAKRTSVFIELRKNKGHRYAVIEGNRDCNRHCSYCAVPQQYKREQESTLEETYRQVDWVRNQGYRVMSYIGGEPFAPFKTKEGITFAQHTTEVVRYATKKGMFVHVTTNGDFVDEDTVKSLKEAGLYSMGFSLHTYSKAGLNHVLKGARLAAQYGIIPTVQVVFTSERTSQIPGIAAHVAEQGILFSVAIAQEKGGGFSAARKEQSIVPTVEQQKEVLGALLMLKEWGFVRDNKNYLTQAPSYPNNSWTCDPERDTFIHIGAGGKLDVCHDVRTDIDVGEIEDLSNERWRDLKRKLVANCGNCMYGCYYEAQNPSLIADWETLMVINFIKNGRVIVNEKKRTVCRELVKKKSQRS